MYVSNCWKLPAAMDKPDPHNSDNPTYATREESFNPIIN